MTDSDEALIELIRNGNLNAFEQLIARYEIRVYTIAYRYVGNHSDASDLAQEAMIRVYRSIGTFRGDSAFLTWLYRVVTNVCKDELRRRARQNTVSMDEMLEHGQVPVVQAAEKPPEEAVLRKEWQEEIQVVLNSLSEEHRTVVVMRDIQGYSYEEIAGFLECSLGTVKSRLNRARNLLKERLLSRKDLLLGRACQTS